MLPFDSIGGNPDQEYFADGLTEDIITALSLCHSFPVIAQNSSFTYKGRAVKVQDVARELGARYVLEGSLRKAGDRLRVTAQLVDEHQGMLGWDLESLTAGLTRDRVVQAEQIIAEFFELGPVAAVGSSR